MALVATIIAQPNPASLNQVVMGMVSIQNTGAVPEVILSVTGSIIGPVSVSQGVITQPQLPYVLSAGQQISAIFIQGSCPSQGTYTLIASGTAASGAWSAPPFPFQVATDMSAFSVTATGSTTARSLAARAADVVNVYDYVVGDGVADDSAKFVTACAKAVSFGKPLWLGNAKIYLASLGASIPSDGLLIIGNGQLNFGNAADIPEYWGMVVDANGFTRDQIFNQLRGVLNALSRPVIYSKFNGPLFTGKTFSGYGFTAVGYPASANNAFFWQTTPTAYPGWSQALLNFHDATIAYFGNDSIRLLGGLEGTPLINLQLAYSQGTLLRIKQTVGVNSPIEYIDIDGGAYLSGLTGCIRLEGVGKGIEVHEANVGDGGQEHRLADATYGTSATYTTEPSLVYPIWMQPNSAAGAAPQATNIRIYDNFTEWCQAVVKFDAPASGSFFYKNIVLENNFLIPLQRPPAEGGTVANAVWHIAAFMYKAFDVYTHHNFAPDSVAGAKWWIDSTQGSSLGYLRFDESTDYLLPRFSSYVPLATQFAPMGAGYNASNGQVITSSAFTVIYFHALDWDPYALVTNPGSVSWLFTVSMPGIYQINASVGFNATAAGVAGTLYEIALQKNGVTTLDFSIVTGVQNVGNVIELRLSSAVPLNVGDTITILLFQTCGASVTLLSNSANNRFSAFRLAR